MTEENVTKAIINYLESSGWKIVCFDFPQSGTGISLHLNQSLRSGKNKGLIIPDIIAYRNKKVLFFENKDRYVFSDIFKINAIKSQNRYSESLGKLLSKYDYDTIYFGIGLPHIESNILKALNNANEIDFAIFVKEDNSVVVRGKVDLIFQ